MANPTITIPLDPQTAQAYNSASAEEKAQDASFSWPVAPRICSRRPTLLGANLDEAGLKVQARGLTPEMLESLLKGA